MGHDHQPALVGYSTWDDGTVVARARFEVEEVQRSRAIPRGSSSLGAHGWGSWGCSGWVQLGTSSGQGEIPKQELRWRSPERFEQPMLAHGFFEGRVSGIRSSRDTLDFGGWAYLGIMDPPMG